MTRDRLYGTDVPFCAWMRKNDSLSSQHFVATDCDLWLHVYRFRLDGKRTRRLQGIQFLEVKTRGGGVPSSQLDTLWKVHLTIDQRTKTIDGNDVANAGVSFVRMSGTRPDESDWIDWGRFDKSGAIKWNRVGIEQLELLMLMEHDPQTLEPTFRRLHHKTQVVYDFKKTPLGFIVAEASVKRS